MLESDLISKNVEDFFVHFILHKGMMQRTLVEGHILSEQNFSILYFLTKEVLIRKFHYEFLMILVDVLLF